MCDTRSASQSNTNSPARTKPDRKEKRKRNGSMSKEVGFFSISQSVFHAYDVLCFVLFCVTCTELNIVSKCHTNSSTYTAEY